MSPDTVTRPAAEVERRAEHRTLWRLRIAVGALLLTALAFNQSGGRIVPDTKLDLTADPGAFLARALHMWDPSGAFGQLQNQAYGYLFPIGPFHWALVSAGLPGWVVQRLWWSVVLVTAFVGIWRLAGALRLGTPWSRYAAALLFALSPRLVSEVAVTSVEVWPMALAPWVLLPLVDPTPRSWAGRLMRSGAAVALLGGVNAVASGAALVLPTLWLVTRRPVRRALLRFGQWLAVVVGVCLWWLVPLVLLGRSSPPFLDWIENAPVTTRFASPFESLRGTTTWLSYLTGPAGPSWPAGWQYVTTTGLVLATGVVAVVGLVGVARAPARHRSFLGVSLLVGLVLVGLGHTGPAQSPAGPFIQSLLDAGLAPLRNTHKFELVVRVPLALGVAVAGAAGAATVRRIGLARWLGPVVATALVVIVAAPAVVGTMAKPESYRAIPAYWHEAARWLDRSTEPGTTLVVPAAGFADFVWGSTKDDPLQALGRSAFAVRDAVPLGSAGGTRWLDDVESRLRSGRPGASFVDELGAAGVQFVLVRNDIRPDAADRSSGTLLRVHQSLAVAGLERVASFGAPVGVPKGALESPTSTTDQRSLLPYPALEVYATGFGAEATYAAADELVSVVGGPEDVADATTALGDARPGVLDRDTGPLRRVLGASLPTVLTDGNQDREVFFGRPADNTSAVRAPGEPRRTAARVSSYVVDPSAPQTRRSWTGLRAVTASSSASDANASLRLGPGYGPQALVDDDPSTAWVSGAFGSATGEWVQLDLTSARDPAGLTVSLEQAPRRALRPTSVRVDTARGSRTTTIPPGASSVVLATAPGTTSRVRVTVTGTDPASTGAGVAFAGLSLPRVDLGSELVLPEAGSRTPSAVVLRRATAGRSACPLVGSRPLCLAGTGRQGESEGGLRRSLDLPAALTGAMSGTVTPRSGRSLDRLLDGFQQVTVEASSRAVAEPAGRPGAVVDGDLGTGWVAGRDDARPRLTLRYAKPVASTGMQLQRDASLAGSSVAELAVSFDGATPRRLTVDARGFVAWPRTTFRTLTVDVLSTTPLRSTDSVSGFVDTLPVGISEVVVRGAPAPRVVPLGTTTGVACGFGPELTVGGIGHATRVSGTVGDLLGGGVLTWSACDRDGVALPAGRVLVDAAPSAEFDPATLTISRGQAAEPARAPTAVDVRRDAPGTVSIALAERPGWGLVVVHQNYAAGWSATDRDGSLLTPVRVGGWQQGWLVPPGAATTLTASYGPDTPYRAALLGGGLLLVATLAGLAARARRRPPVPVPFGVDGRGRAWATGVVVGLVALGGLWGLGAALIAAFFVAVVPRSRGTVVITMGLLAALVAAMNPWTKGLAGVDGLAPQVLTLAAVATAVWGSTRVVRLRLPRFMIGRSSR